MPWSNIPRSKPPTVAVAQLCRPTAQLTAKQTSTVAPVRTPPCPTDPPVESAMSAPHPRQGFGRVFGRPSAVGGDCQTGAMTSGTSATGPKADLHQYLRRGREAVLWKL